MSNPEELKSKTAGAQVEGTRREFFRACLRYPVLIGLGAISGVLVLRGLHSSGVVPCIKSRVCKGCKLLDNCDKPQAAQAKKSGSMASK
jgi:hypothetical protein